MSSLPEQLPSTHSARRHAPSLSWQAMSFAAVGVSGTAVTFVLLTLLHKGLGWGIVVANVPAYAAGIVNNYTWNRVWTFRHIERRNMLHQGGQFAAVSLGGLIINTTVLWFCEHIGVAYLLSFGIAVVIAYGWNFYLNHKVTFRHRLPRPHLHGHGGGTAVVPSDGD
ncbi:MAG: GtrA family protein [Dehalococcoidia bacterium]